MLGSAGLLGGGKALGSSTTLTVIGGDVQVRHGASGQFVAAVDGEVLQAGDAIQTSTDARAVLTFFEGSTVTIEPASQLQIDTATFQGSNTIVQMTQSVGRTWHVVTKLVTGDSKYEVRTPASTASVRGTEFQVDNDANGTTITTTEGTVLDKVPDPQNPTQTIDVPVTAGTQHVQPKAAPPAPVNPAPAPDRKVTVTVDADNSLIVDPLGRANGVTADGKVIAQTPGAIVTKDNGKIVIVLPNIPDGTVAAHVDKSKSGDKNDVNVHATVSDKNGNSEDVDDQAKQNDDNDKSNGRFSTGFEVKKGNDGKSDARKLDDSEKKNLQSARLPGQNNVKANQAPTAGPATSNTETSPTVAPTPAQTESAQPTETEKPTETPEATRRPTPPPPPTPRTPEPPTPQPRPTEASKPTNSFLPNASLCIPTASNNCSADTGKGGSTDTGKGGSTDTGKGGSTDTGKGGSTDTGKGGGKDNRQNNNGG